MIRIIAAWKQWRQISVLKTKIKRTWSKLFCSNFGRWLNLKKRTRKRFQFWESICKQRWLLGTNWNKAFSTSKIVLTGFNLPKNRKRKNWSNCEFKSSTLRAAMQKHRPKLNWPITPTQLSNFCLLRKWIVKTKRWKHANSGIWFR